MTEPKMASPLRTRIWLLAILAVALGTLLIWNLIHTHQQIQAHKATIDEKGQALTAAQAEVGSLQDKLQALGTDLGAATKAQQDLKARIQAKQQENDATLASLRNEITSLRQAASEANATYEAHIQRITDDLTEEVVKFRTLLVGSDPDKAAMMASWEKRILAAKSEVLQARQDLESERGKLASLEQDLTQTKQLNEALKQDLSEAGQKVEAAQTALDQERAALASLRGEHEGLQGRLEQSQVSQARIDTLTQAAADKEGALNHLKSLYHRLSSLGGRSTEKGTLLALSEDDVRFQAGKADLPKGEIPRLNRIAAVLVEFPELKVRIEGHTDSSGRDEANRVVSQQRADAVLGALVARGVTAERLTAEGMGKAKPIATNDTPAGRSQNRRVEIYIIEP